MTDTTRSNFEVWFSNTFGPSSLKKTSGNKYLWSGVDATYQAYQAATLKERERCAMLAAQLAEDAAIIYANGHQVNFNQAVGNPIRSGQ